MSCRSCNVPYSPGIEAKENLFPCLFFVNSSNVFNKSNIDRYMWRLSAKSCNGKYRIWEDFCCKEFLTYYTFENKSSNTYHYQQDELDDNLIVNNHKECSYTPKIKLMISGETMLCRKVKQILRYNVPKNLLSVEKLIKRCFWFLRSDIKNNWNQVVDHCIETNCKNEESRAL